MRNNSHKARLLPPLLIALAFAMPSIGAQAAPLEISAGQELIWDQTKGLYEAVGDATASRGEQSISADTLTAYYDIQSDDQDIERIIATTNVSFTDADITGQGTRLDYDITQNTYELDGPNAYVTSKDGKASADEIITFDRTNGLIIAKGKGDITLADGRLLQGDLLEITLTQTEEISLVTAIGNVYVRQQNGREARAQSGTYNAETGKALLTGDVKIIDGESVLNGQTAEIDFNNGISRLIAEEGKGRVSGTLADDS